MSKIDRGNKFLGGFAGDNVLEDMHIDKSIEKSVATNIAENEESYLLEVGIPFSEKKDLKVLIKNSSLIIDAKAKDENSDYKSIQKKFTLPGDSNKDEINARVNDNRILEIEIPKLKFDKDTSRLVEVK